MLAVILPLLASAAYGQDASSTSASCSATPLPTKVPAPVAADGFSVKLVANGLTRPRGIAFDSEGHLLVVDSGRGIVGMQLDDQGGDCVSVQSQSVIIQDDSLNHGIAFNKDFSTLYVSSADIAYAYGYNAQQMARANQDPGQEIVTGMAGSDHTTRTMLFSNFTGDTPTLLITRGSTSNIDAEALEIASGHSQIKSFDISNTDGRDFNGAGTILGWGLRNDVGLAEHPVTGGIYSVENSVDMLMRSGQDIHANNPAEELNFLGYINPDNIADNAYMANAPGGPNANQGGNFGYPQCFTAWEASEVPDYPDLQTGQQFAIGGQNYSTNDTYCSQQVAPRLSMPAHTAPLDIKFNSAGTEAWVASHGSWNRDEPIGYKVSAIPFDAQTGEPVAPANSMTGFVDVVTNADNSKCPDNCFRPVALAFDNAGRLFFSSDSTGEIYMITAADASSGGVESAMPTQAASPTAGSPTGAAAPGGTSTAAAAVSFMVPGSDRQTYKGVAAVGVTLAAVLFAGLLL